jgi:hypothetical protein
MNKIKKIVILNFETQEVLIYSYDENVWSEAEDFIENLKVEGLEDISSTKSCQWMVVDDLVIKVK